MKRSVLKDQADTKDKLIKYHLLTFGYVLTN